MRDNVLGGGLICIISCVIGGAALASPFGTPSEMGPGFFPLVLSILLGALGITIMVTRPGEEEGSIGRDNLMALPWRGIALVVSGPLVFILTIKLIGLAASVFVVSFIVSFASPEARLVPSLLFSVFLGVVCALIFGIGLNLDLPMLGSLLGGV